MQALSGVNGVATPTGEPTWPPWVASRVGGERPMTDPVSQQPPAQSESPLGQGSPTLGPVMQIGSLLMITPPPVTRQAPMMVVVVMDVLVVLVEVEVDVELEV